MLHNNHFCQISEKLLLCAVWALVTFHMLLAAFRFIIDYRPFRICEYWLIAAVLFSLVLFSIFSFENRHNFSAVLKSLCSYEQLFVIILFLWFIEVCAIRQLSDGLNFLHAEAWWISDMGVSALFLFPLTTLLGGDKSLRLLHRTLHILIPLYSLFSFWALWKIICSGSCILPSGGILEMRRENMTLSFGIHYNMTGSMACTMLALCLFIFFSHKSLLKWLYIVLSFPHLVVLFLSNSRTSFLGALFFVVLTVFFYSFNLLSKKNILSPHLRSIICVFLGVFCGLFFWFLRSAVITGYVQATASHIFSKKRNLIVNHLVPLVSSRMPLKTVKLTSNIGIREVFTDLNGRTIIWRAVLKVLVSSPLIFLCGVTPSGIPDALATIGDLPGRFSGAHNVFLHVGLSFGVPAMIAFTIFSFRIIIKCLRIIFKTEMTEYGKTFIIPITVLTLFFMNLTEDYLIACYCIQSSIFFLFCGLISSKKL